MSDEYIKREDALKAIHEEWDDVCNYDGSGRSIANETESAIDRAPAADVRPVKRGRWNADGSCSNCGCYRPTDDAHDAIFKDEVHYCYYCGADMWEVDDG